MQVQQLRSGQAEFELLALSPLAVFEARRRMEDLTHFPRAMRGKSHQVERWRRYGEPGGGFRLTDTETPWRDREPFLRSRGYELRPRYRPDWTPSWLGTDVNPLFVEDAILCIAPDVIDAKRISDGKTVAIKCLRKSEHAKMEIEITMFLTSGDLAAHPENHCVQFLDTFENPDEPDHIFIVESWLSVYDRPPMTTVADVLDFVGQTLEGLAFMHDHGVAHRDCTGPNIRMDDASLYPGVDVHPQARRRKLKSPDRVDPLPRSKAGVRYYFIDFDLSTRFKTADGPPLVTGVFGRDQDAPELSETVPYDPCKLDVFILGNVYRTDFLDAHYGLEFLRPLIAAMTATDPSRRPAARSALRTFQALRRNVGWWKTYWRLHPKEEAFVFTPIFDAIHLAQTVISYFFGW